MDLIIDFFSVQPHLFVIAILFVCGEIVFLFSDMEKPIPLTILVIGRICGLILFLVAFDHRVESAEVLYTFKHAAGIVIVLLMIKSGFLLYKKNKK